MGVWQTKLRISDKAMSEFMYAVIMSKANVVKTFGVGIYNYTRKQNSGNMVDVLIEVDNNNKPIFEFYSGLTLKEPQQVHVKSTPTQ